MATKKKGCGFLITALLLLLVGLAIASVLGMSVYNEGKNFVEQTGRTGISFKTPDTASYESPEDSDVTVWMTGGDSLDVDKVIIQVTDTSTKLTRSANKPSGKANFGNKHLVATYPVEAGKNYQFSASGVEDGQHFTISAVSAGTAFSMAGKIFGAILSAGLFGLIALIFGVIGLIKFLGSKNTPAQGPPEL